MKEIRKRIQCFSRVKRHNQNARSDFHGIAQRTDILISSSNYHALLMFSHQPLQKCETIFFNDTRCICSFHAEPRKNTLIISLSTFFC